MPLIPTQIVPSVTRCELNTRQVERELMDYVNSGAPIKVSGTARHEPTSLFAFGLRPKHKIELFGTGFYFTTVLQIPELRFFVCYIVQSRRNGRQEEIFPRIIYKDLSLAWRTASHYSMHGGEIWIGKGDIREELRDGHEYLVSNEATTELPIEMQTAVETLLDHSKRAKSSQESVLEMVLRKSPPDRVEPYRDFSAPRKNAAATIGNLIYGGRSIAKFTRRNDPRSLKIVAGFEPDFEAGILETSQSHSRLYGGLLRRFRILSKNRQIQFYFIAGPKQVWLFPTQALTTELSSYGVRTIDVNANDDLFIPGYEYHHYEETVKGHVLYSQIPPGFAGEQCPDDDAKADASPWLDKLPIIQQFREQVLQQ